MKAFLAYPVVQGFIQILFWLAVLAVGYWMFTLLVDFVFAYLHGFSR